MRITLISLFSLLCVSCSRMPDHMQTGYSMIHTHYENVASTKNWIPHAIGGSFYGGDIKALFSHLIVVLDDLDIKKCRQFLIEGSTGFLETINENENAIDHLNHFPFTHKDIKYSLMICSKDGKLLGDVLLLKGKIFYSKSDEFEHLVDVHKETYAEALELLKSDHADVASKD